MKKNLFKLAILALFTAVLLMACGEAGKEPAQLAIKAAEEAVGAAKTEAGKIIPDEVAQLENALASVKEKLSGGKYKEALTDAQALVAKAKEVVASAQSKKDELTKQWTELSQGLPKMVAAVESRVNILSQAKKLPANLTAEAFEETKSGLAAAKADWAKAQESFSSGNLAEAISAANSVKEKAVKAMETLGLPVPAGAKS
ncbi:MAG: hypothetical protein PHG54_11985 [Smithellaceae bacterium]|nr:hypothetical protein [Syntrophaceae bacterium]MDD4242137.1 hypothetical protein [Smithellaceae bacterium]NLX50526.1 hypothetical protein [Deltaproteobacteria bacterium]